MSPDTVKDTLKVWLNEGFWYGEISLNYPVGFNVFKSTIRRGMQEGDRVREGDVTMEEKVAVMCSHEPRNIGDL